MPSLPQSPSNPPQAPLASQAPGQPLPPGTVSYRNTWNLTQSQQCAYPQLPKEPLLSRASNWTIGVDIPTILFMGKESTSSVKHTYTFYANGTYLARDDRGNSFAVGSLVGLPPGKVVTTLRANSTVAIQNYLLTVGSQTTANVSVSYLIRHQFCQPAGLKVKLQGRLAIAPGSSSVISLAFNKPPISLKNYRAWFGNSSGVALGFDWSDSV